MIVACFYFSSSDYIKKLEIIGHAGSAPKGGDLVCAGVSAQVILLEIAAMSYEKETIIEKSSGFFSISDPQSSEVQGILRSLHLSFLAMESEFERYVQVKEVFELEELWQQKKAADPVKTDAIANPNA